MAIERQSVAVLAERIAADHGADLLAIARRHSNCAADAEDAFQRAMETLLTKAPSTDEPRVLAWLAAVVRNEALAAHRRSKWFARKPIEDSADGELRSAAAGPEEQLLQSELLGQGREVLHRLRTDQSRCLLLRADGLDYDEICRLTGFSYAKVNRCLSEGRKAFRVKLGLIDAGSECQRLLPTLSMISDGVADSTQVRDAELHLGNCLACRQTLAAYRSAPSELAALLPVGLALQQDRAGVFERVGDTFQSALSTLHDRLAGQVVTHQSAEIFTAKKAVVATAITAAIVTGGALLGEREHAADREHSASVPSAGDAAEAAEAAAHRNEFRGWPVSNGRPIAAVARGARTSDLTDPDAFNRAESSDSADDTTVPPDPEETRAPAGADAGGDPPAGFAP